MKAIENIKTGDVIVFKSEWMDKGDENYTFRAAEDYDGSGRLLVVCELPNFTFKPTEIIRVNMIAEVK